MISALIVTGNTGLRQPPSIRYLADSQFKMVRGTRSTQRIEDLGKNTGKLLGFKFQEAPNSQYGKSKNDINDINDINGNRRLNLFIPATRRKITYLKNPAEQPVTSNYA